MAVVNTYKKFLAGGCKEMAGHFPMRSVYAPSMAIPELNPEPTTARGWRRRNKNKK